MMTLSSAEMVSTTRSKFNRLGCSILAALLPLPEQSNPFEEATLPSASPTRADLFVTCIIDQLYPQVGVSVVRVLRRLGVDVAFPADQTCCGQPLYNSGYTNRARQLGQRVLKSFVDSEYVVVPSGSCAAMMRVFYLDLFENEPAMLEQARRMAPKVYEFSQFLTDVLGVEGVGTT